MFFITNDFWSHETGTSLFDLDLFKGKALDEVDFDLTVYLQLQADSKETLDLNSFKETTLIDNVMFFKIFFKKMELLYEKH